MDNNFLILSEVSYGNNERHKVDIFIPDNAKSASGILLYIHGGGWTMGDKTVHHTDAEHFCKLGYICATMNYRYVDENINIFDELDDITSALKTIKFKCKEHGFDIKKSILSGGSAGGHLALLYAYSRKSEAPVNISAACVYCPPTDCSKADFLMGISGEFEDWKNGVLSDCCGIRITKENFINEPQQTALKKISPCEYISENCVPTAVFHGKADDLVPFEHTIEFLELLDINGVKNDLLVYENSGHALDKDPECAERAKKIIKDYLKIYF